jgi:hypothetical protein
VHPPCELMGCEIPTDASGRHDPCGRPLTRGRATLEIRQSPTHVAPREATPGPCMRFSAENTRQQRQCGRFLAGDQDLAVRVDDLLVRRPVDAPQCSDVGEATSRRVVHCISVCSRWAEGRARSCRSRRPSTIEPTKGQQPGARAQPALLTLAGARWPCLSPWWRWWASTWRRGV